MYILIFCM
ncbi:hypothetical protein [Plasmodium yoelii yoelii]|uniref:Uncharacterized protein n=1 Tax=Plasmodium yoelii yoelii TaxID=73239 RepID=Q7RBP6_PLAYO|nr:hypothetical protein [Plasmodium yoelii yoelii]